MVKLTPQELPKLSLSQREAYALGQLELARTRRRLLETARGKRHRQWIPIMLVFGLLGLLPFLPLFRVDEHTQVFIFLIFFSVFLAVQEGSADRRIDALVKLLEEDLRRDGSEDLVELRAAVERNADKTGTAWEQAKAELDLN